MHNLGEAKTALDTASQSGEAASQAAEQFKTECAIVVALIVKALNDLCDTAGTTHQVIEAHQSNVTAAMGAVEDAWTQAVALGDREALTALQTVKEHLESAVAQVAAAADTCTAALAPLNDAKEGAAYEAVSTTMTTIDNETHEALKVAAAAISAADATVASRMD
jgi:hypothetical protein